MGCVGAKGAGSSPQGTWIVQVTPVVSSLERKSSKRRLAEALGFRVVQPKPAPELYERSVSSCRSENSLKRLQDRRDQLRVATNYHRRATSLQVHKSEVKIFVGGAQHVLEVWDDEVPEVRPARSRAGTDEMAVKRKKTKTISPELEQEIKEALDRMERLKKKARKQSEQWSRGEPIKRFNSV